MTIYDYILENILIIDGTVSIYLLAAVILSILGLSVNIFGLKRKYEVGVGLIYLVTIMFVAYMFIALLSAIMGGLTLILYYTSFMLAASIPAFTAVAIMNKYAGRMMEVNSRPFLVYIVILLFVLILTLFTYPGKPFLLGGAQVGQQVLPFETRLVYNLILYPTVALLSIVPIISMFKLGIRKAPILISLGSLTLIGSLATMELGLLTFTDLLLLITAILYIFGFNSYIKAS